MLKANDKHRVPHDAEAAGSTKLLNDIAANLPQLKLETIIEVGANLGTSLSRFLHLTEARVIGFDLSKSSFAKIEKKQAEVARSRVLNLALGSKAGQAQLNDKQNSILSLTPGKVPASELIDVITGDEFCAREKIDRVSLLKIGTEGFDFNVVEGFRSMWDNQQIDMVQVGCSMNITNRKWVPFAAFFNYFSARDYHLFGLYDMAFELDGRPTVRRCNPVFISSSVIMNNKKSNSLSAAQK
ncbi:FkbM family methyltransferase [Ancylobacter oerskovii]|uniref:FkbM family methyltransferase n=1 Tax=Ancylobacter oerskovii TaxID=459519 RepID=A0ABW4Z1I6_9HYPH|nr:FkbM family methyltransferase [Ancylobacter oerskovii]MBS7545053.1 FkbM family methyltransferase [Ancylobacter oerskovii]